MIEIHQDEIQHSHSYDEAYSYLKRMGEIKLTTSAGTNFMVFSSITKDGRFVIRFFQKGKEYARAYNCCWGHYNPTLTVEISHSSGISTILAEKTI